MFKKSHRLSGVCCAVLVMPAGLPTIATAATFQNGSIARVGDKKAAQRFDCRKQNEYRFAVVGNANRKKDSDHDIPEDVNIMVGEEVVSKIELPTEPEVKNFSLDSIENNKSGFQIKVNWGSGLNHYEIEFNFRCKEGNFYLDKVKKESLSSREPDSGSFLDKKESKVTKIEPNLAIERFVMKEYLQLPE